MKTKDLLKTKLSSLAGPPLRQPRPLDERLRPARRQPDDHDDRDGRQSGIRLRRPQATVETFTQVPDYTVTFQADGATVKTMTVEDGYTLKDSDYPAVPTKTGYTGEWVKYTSAVHSNVTVQAKYTAVVTKYTVTFKADNTVVKTMTVKDGYTLKASDYPTVPAKSGYKGSWKRYTAAIHSDITIDAVYEPVIVTKQYTVVFRADAKVLKTMKVEVGYTLQDSDYPEIPAKEGYTGHWDKSTTRIIKNTIINVIYSDNSSHVVTFIFDGAQIGTLTVTDGYVLKNSDYPSPFAPVGYIVTWEKYTLPIHSDITVTGKLQSDVTIPPQPTDPGEIMSGGEGEPVEADVPAEDETVSPQGTHVTGTQTVTHEYLTLSGKVARETIKTNDSLTAVLDFIYDESGKPFALKYSTNGTSFQTYYYVLNLQGDVVKLIHYIPGFEYESVATYEYDAWGNIVSSSGRLAEINPLRYRGYYYDNETGFYYLQSRYYDPANRRFISADVYASTGQGFVGTNMFAYCVNNPVFLTDEDGNFAIAIGIGAAVEAICGSVAAAGLGIVLLGELERSTKANREAMREAVKAKVDAMIAADSCVPEPEPRDNSVYVLYDTQNNENIVKYVGRTNNPKRRLDEHRRSNSPKRDYDMRVVITGLTKSEAMVAEQVLISAYTLKYLDNARREIAAKNVDNYLQYTAAVAELLACGAEETLIGLMRE